MLEAIVDEGNTELLFFFPACHRSAYDLSFRGFAHHFQFCFCFCLLLRNSLLGFQSSPVIRQATSYEPRSLYSKALNFVSYIFKNDPEEIFAYMY